MGSHHGPDGRFRNPWPPHPDLEDRTGGVFAWMWDRVGQDLPPDPEPGEVPSGVSDPAHPRASPDEIRVTFVGHATLLIQVAGLNLLTDPIWSRRAGPFSLLGGPRFAEPGMPLEDLPALDAVLLSHGHYDHLDVKTVRRVRDRFGTQVPWMTPLGYEPWLRRHGMERVHALDWWHQTTLDGPAGGIRFVCLPVRHWTRRGLHANRELWGSWAILPAGIGADVPSHGSTSDDEPEAVRRPRGVYFGGDSGYCPAFREIGSRLGPFRMSILPVGAYEPRWFMADSHMNPEEAVQAYLDLGGRGAFLGMHWGAFRLTDEDPLEPPQRTRRAWRDAGLPEEDLHLPGNGGTVRLEGG